MEKCKCCGKLITKGAILDSGDKIGLDCFALFERARFYKLQQINPEKAFALIGSTKKVKDYILRVI